MTSVASLPTLFPSTWTLPNRVRASNLRSRLQHAFESLRANEPNYAEAAFLVARLERGVMIMTLFHGGTPTGRPVHVASTIQRNQS